MDDGCSDEEFCKARIGFTTWSICQLVPTRQNGSYVLSSRSSTTGGGSTGRLSTIQSVQAQLDHGPW